MMACRCGMCEVGKRNGQEGMECAGVGCFVGLVVGAC